ncbi:MAG: hypothetical protein KF774_12810 [Planctomyces sp.]|nr:hypothetical protein [Planctomyces sp.]
MSGTRITDAAADSFRRMTQLETLFLSRTGLTGPAIGRLAENPRLRALDVSQTALSDADLDEMPPFQRVARLYISGTAMTGQGLLRNIGKWPALRDLHVSDGQLTAEDAERMRPLVTILIE